MPALGEESAAAVYPAAPSVLPDVTCEPTSPATCLPCFDEDLVRCRRTYQTCCKHRRQHAASPRFPRLQDQTFCSTTGYKREVKCMYKTPVVDNASIVGTSMVSREPYLAFQGCSPEPTNSFAAVVRFEVRSRPGTHARHR